MSRCRTALPLLLLLSSCREFVAPAGGGQPVVSFVIIGGDSVHTGSVTLSARPDSALPDSALPADPAQISLEIVDSAGNRYPLVPGTVPGRYTALFAAIPGRRYDLAGTAYGEVVSAQTRLPVSFTIVAPTADTITAADGTTTIVQLIVPYEFQAPGADGFAAFLMTQTGALESQTRYRNATGQLVLIRAPVVRPLSLLAYDPAAAGCFLPLRPYGNIDGTLGCFGSALRQTRWVNAP